MAAPEAFDWLRYGLSVVLVLGLLALALVWLRRSAAAGQIGDSGRRLQIIDRLRLSPRQQILWVRAGDREVLLAVSPQEVRTLTPLSSSVAGQAAQEDISHAS